MRLFIVICAVLMVGCTTVPKPSEKPVDLPPAEAIERCEDLSEVDTGTLLEFSQNKAKDYVTHFKCSSSKDKLILFTCRELKLDINVCKQLEEELKNARQPIR